MKFAKSWYGCHWEKPFSQLDAAMYCIRQGGRWKEDGIEMGADLFTLYRDVQSILWPEDDHHEWSDLVLKSILENRITAVVGPKDSSKTRTVAKYTLIDYWAFPEITLVLISSTQMRSLELRIWGDIKSLYNRAREVWPDIPGNVIDSLHGIFTHELGDGITDARDQRCGLICLPVKDAEGKWQGMDKWCFPAGTLVDTPSGQVPIETLREGDEVISAVGPRRVIGTSRRITDELARVTFQDGRQVVCTPNHRFLTSEGWKKALDLTIQSFVFSSHDSLRHLWQSCGRGFLSHEILFDGVPYPFSKEDVSTVWEGVSSRIGPARNILLHAMCPVLDMETAGHQEASYRINRQGSEWRGHPTLNHVGPGEASEEVYSLEENPGQVWAFGVASPVMGYAKEEWRESVQEPRERIPSFRRRESVRCTVSRSGAGVNRSLWKETQRRLSALLQARLRMAGFETRGRNRRRDTLSRKADRERQAQGGSLTGSWVDTVEVFKCSDDPQWSASEGGCPVYNLEVEGNPSYSVNGFIVHNCGVKQKRRRVIGDEVEFYSTPYLSTLSNLDKGDFKGIFIGNPLGEGDPLDKISEPEDGWGTEGEVTKTVTWKNRWEGITVQLYGPDSPAVRHPGKYPYLTNQEDIDRIVKRYGKDSAEHWMQGLGIRPPGMSTRRVVTREMAVQFGAHDEVVWGGGGLTPVLGLDAAYGGDACIAIPANFGKDINGTQVLVSEEPLLIPIRLYPKNVPEDERMIPEDQIATRVKDECTRRGIPPENMFFDSTGRGSLGTSFARIWSADVNPVESGGNPSERPVAADLYMIDDKTGQRRLVRANEYYSKRVTEYWFSVRYAIEGRQIRKLPVSVLDEFAAREWTIVRGNKRELENKDETKERLGRSPDRADAYAIMTEGARRLGFVIKGLEQSENKTAMDFRWKRDLQDRVQRFKRNFALAPTA